jgi:hypothetical protein
MMKTFLKYILLLAAVSVLATAQPPQKATKDTGPSAMLVQDKKADTSPNTQVRSETEKSSYRLDFKIYELESGKRTNERDYSMIATVPGSWSTLKIGTRVPVAMKEGQTQYLDVGVDLRCRLNEQTGKLFLNVITEISSFALPEQNADPRGSTAPVVRNSNSNVESQISLGKPLIIASVDDVNSKKRTQIEVTTTKIE